jgi:hypothetical protein
MNLKSLQIPSVPFIGSSLVVAFEQIIKGMDLSIQNGLKIAN